MPKRRKLTARLISEVMREMGRKGGQASNAKKGFGTGNRAKAASAARWAKYYAAHPEKAGE